MRQPADNRSLGDLFSDLGDELSTLVRQEIRLARTEMGEKAPQVARSVGYVAAAGAVAYAGFLALVAAAVIGLAALGLPWWVSALLVGVAVAGVGYWLYRKGMGLLREVNLLPEKTIYSLKEDTRWARNQMR